MMTDDLDKEMEAFIEERFNDNLVVIETENNLRLNSYVRKEALLQVQMYWKRLKALAQRVTQSEVPVTLSRQQTPKGRPYTITGVVDIVREQEHTVLYDIKTHDPAYIRAHKDWYEKQLAVYGSIWEGMYQKKLDATAIITTPLPVKLRDALRNGTDAQKEAALWAWEPVIELSYDEATKEETLHEFGTIVDNIEECTFDPPPPDLLRSKLGGGKAQFAKKICWNCDIRFACDSYREYSTGRRTLSSDDLLYLIKQMGTDEEQNTFKQISFEADVAKEFEASTDQVESIREEEFEK